MKFNDVVVAGLVAGAVLAGPVRGASAAQTTSPAAMKVDDSTIQSSIEETLKKNSSLAPRDIDVEVDKGVVTLTGEVRTAADKAAAGRLAQVNGVTRVSNQIEVNPKIDESKLDAAANKTKSGLNKAVDATVKAAEKTKEGVQKGVGKTEQGLGKVAEKTSDAVGKAGDKMTDASVTTGVKSGLTGEALLRDSAIDVDTTNHVVTLRGTVASAAAKARAAAIAADSKGVTRVVNELVVRGS